MLKIEQLFILIAHAHIPLEQKKLYIKGVLKMFEQKEDNPQLRKSLSALFRQEAQIRVHEAHEVDNFIARYHQKEEEEAEKIKPALVQLVKDYQAKHQEIAIQYREDLNKMIRDLEKTVHEAVQNHEQQDIDDIRKRLGLG